MRSGYLNGRAGHDQCDCVFGRGADVTFLGIYVRHVGQTQGLTLRPWLRVRILGAIQFVSEHHDANCDAIVCRHDVSKTNSVLLRF